MMESQSARLEREAELVRYQLSETLEELRGRMTPGRVVDQMIDYTRDGPAAEFLRNLGRDVRDNPMPLVLIGIGIVWLLVASNRASRAAIASPADTVAKKADDIAATTAAAVSRTSEWGQQTASRLADRASRVAAAVSNTTAELTDRARDVTGSLAKKAGSASSVTVSTFQRAKRPFADASEDAPIRSGDPAASAHRDDVYTDVRR
jgi:Protein of unknown function (DUF3618)